MAGEDHVGDVAPTVHGLVDVAAPHEGVAHQGAAQGEHVVHGAGAVLGHAEDPAVREVEVHLGRCLGFRGELELDPDAVQHELLAGLGDLDGGSHQCRGPGGDPLAQALVHVALLVGRQEHPELVGGPATHGGSGDHVLGDRLVQESLRGHDRNLAGLHPGPVDHAQHAAVVVDVGVGVDHGRDRSFAQVFGDQVVGGGGGLGGGQRVDDHPSDVAPDERDAGGVEATHLVEAVDDLVEAVLGVEACLAPERRVDGLRAWGMHEVRRREVPGDGLPRVGDQLLDDRFGPGRDEAPGDVGCIGAVVGRQGRSEGLEVGPGVGGGRLAGARVIRHRISWWLSA